MSERVYGLLAELESQAALVAAAQRAREAGYRRFDAHSPFPVHGIDAAMAIRMTRLPWLVLVGGIIPDVDIDFLKQQGVSGIFQPGTAMDDIVRFIREHLKPRGVPAA